MGVRIIGGSYGHCTNKWHCVYIPLIVMYAVGFVLVAGWIINRAFLVPLADRRFNKIINGHSSSPSSSSLTTRRRFSWPPECLRRDVCLWPFSLLLVLLPALLWPAIAAVCLLVLAGSLLSLGLWELGKAVVRQTSRAQSCCGIPLRRRGSKSDKAKKASRSRGGGAAGLVEEDKEKAKEENEGKDDGGDDAERGCCCRRLSENGAACAEQRRDAGSVVSKPLPTYAQTPRMYG